MAPEPALPRADVGEPAEDEELYAYLRQSPPWLVSAIIHMGLLIVLGLWVLAVQHDPPVELEVTLSEERGEQLDDFTFSTSLEDLYDEEIITPEHLPEVLDPFAAPINSEIAIDANKAMSEIAAPVVGLALSGREAGMKQSLLAAYGGDATTESAVQKGLAWLARNQQRDGSWSLAGPYSGGAVNENKYAATAMALLAFQGAGHTHQSGEHSRQVARGWNWLLKQQDADGNFFHSGSAHHRLYTQAQCTIALCELYGMTKDEKFKKPAEKAVQYAIRVQDQDAGGWRYNPGSGADTSVTGWFVMALQSARMAYIPVPEESLDLVSKYLDSAQTNDGSGYLYMPGSHGGAAMDAEGLLCRQYLGWQRNDPRLVLGAQQLVANPVDWNDRDCYYWYYATQVCHHMEGDIWRAWNKQMKEVIPPMQTQRGAERGSWDPDGDQWGPHGGRLYVTCLHIYMLEVYYRHLPIYQYRVFIAPSDGPADRS